MELDRIKLQLNELKPRNMYDCQKSVSESRTEPVMSLTSLIKTESEATYVAILLHLHGIRGLAFGLIDDITSPVRP